MKKSFKKLICIILCILLFVFSNSAGMCSAAYPEGVGEEQVLNAIKGTDNLILNALPLLTGGDLTSLINGMLYTDEGISEILVNIYSSISENGDELNKIGIDCSPKHLSDCLSGYPEVSNVLKKSDSWADIKIKGMKWGVTDKYGFADALSRMLTPFNDILYMLLCSGQYKMNSFIKIDGADGYQNAIVPVLLNLDCNDLLTQAQFTEQAQNDKNSMIKNIILPVLNMVDEALKSPADSLSSTLPKVAFFIENDGLGNAITTLLKPVTENPLVEIAVFLKILDLDSLTNIDTKAMLNDMTKGLGDDVSLPEIDFSILAACGTESNGVFTPNKAEAFTEILTWIIEAVKMNSDSMGEFLGDGSEFLTEILKKDTALLVKTIILLFNPEEPGGAESMIYPAFIPGTAKNTTSLTDENLEKVYNEIDDLLDDFVKEGGSYSSMGSLIACSLYTNKNITSLVGNIYSALEKEGIGEIIKLLGVDISPKGVASQLTEWGYKSTVEDLNSYSSWEKAQKGYIDWNVHTGSRRSFQDALVASLRPIVPLLRVVLAEEDVVILNSITIKGADGYNTAVIPVLEALGCNEYSIKSYASYKTGAGDDDVLDDILEPVFDLLDDVGDKPVQTLIDRLPNIIYFMQSGSLEKCISNLLLPVTSLVNRVPGIFDMDLSMTEMTEDFSVDAIADGLIENSGFKIADFDINEIAKLGTAVTRESKSVIDGKKQSYTYIEADRNGIIITLLRIVARTMKLPGNENLMMSSMGGGAAANFDVSSMTSQFENMTEDEFIEWLYNLFFKKRVKVEIVTGDDYSPTIIYSPEEKSNTPLIVTIGYLITCLIVGAIIFLNRKRLYD